MFLFFINVANCFHLDRLQWPLHSPQRKQSEVLSHGIGEASSPVCGSESSAWDLWTSYQTGHSAKKVVKRFKEVPIIVTVTRFGTFCTRPNQNDTVGLHPSSPQTDGSSHGRVTCETYCIYMYWTRIFSRRGFIGYYN